ncbi:unnamed protein product, partial [Musa acuminata subsp. burmannicoides]
FIPNHGILVVGTEPEDLHRDVAKAGTARGGVSIATTKDEALNLVGYPSDGVGEEARSGTVGDEGGEEEVEVVLIRAVGRKVAGTCAANLPHEGNRRRGDEEEDEVEEQKLGGADRRNHGGGTLWLITACCRTLW